MSRAARVLAIAAAWALPVVWVGVALTSGPSDGTAVSPPAVVSDAPGWGDSVTIVRTYGETPLEPGNVVQTVEGRPWGSWLTDGGALDVDEGETLTYGILRPGDVGVELQVEVTLTDVAVRSALAVALLPVGLAGAGLLVASFLLWHRPGAAAHRALLAGVSLSACGITTLPLGLAAVDAVGGRGLWPHVGGGVAFVLGLVCLVVVTVTLVPPDSRPRWAWPAAAGPVLGYVAWVVGVAAPREDGPYQLQALLTIAGPAAIGATVSALVLLAVEQARAPRRPERLASRLVLLVLLGAIGVRLLLVDVPTRLVGQPLVPATAVTAVVVATVLLGVVIALLRYRLDVVEPNVRRALLQATLVGIVGGAFLVGVGVVDRASDRSFESMLAGGVIALLVLPLAVASQRLLRRRLNRDRELPRQVVAELRRLDPAAAPEEAVRETLALLADRLRLSYAAIEADDGPDRAVRASVGTPLGATVTVDLLAGGSRLGRLELGADPDRDPFGSADRQLLADVGAEVGALVQAVLMSTELQRSRQRLITTREEERRRLRRDLHDGLGPSLATMAIQLETARDLIADDPDTAAELVERLSDRARNDIAEIRRLVDGLRPPALDQLGLVSALRQRAEEHGFGTPEVGGQLRWTVVADDDVEPLPAAVEVAAYRIVVEAVNNAQRHSGAARCEVRLEREDGVLAVRVSDDGRGLADSPGLGVGLTSMRERAEELGGTCTITSDAGAGTVVAARLPLREEADA
jgi:two-component system NarL family sensor kinase